jgi:ABC-type Fe3+-hydroxamate transport system substrate-binding protein
VSRVRVVSLVPSATETLLAWGVEPVAVTRFCEQPDLLKVGGTKDPDLVAIGDLAPDLVVMCVEENRREDADHLTDAGIAVHAIDIDTVDDVPREMSRLARRLDLTVPEIALPPQPPPSGRVAFVPIWRRPWMTVSGRTYTASVLAWLGLGSAFADHADRYPTIELDDAIAARPDLVVAPDEPYPFGERHRDELSSVGPVVFVDGQDLVWWGIRTPDALRRLQAELARVPT